MTTTYAIRVTDRIEKRTGYLGTRGDSHIVTDAAEARTFPTKKSAQAEIDRLTTTPLHFLTAPSYAASVCRLGVK